MKKKIYVVDDEEQILEILSFNLTKEGYNVREFRNGLELINVLIDNKQSPPDLILLDILMDKMDGLKTCKKIREIEGYENLPVIFLTAKSDEIDKVVGLEMGGDDYITKPFSIKELISRIKAVLRRTAINQDEDKPKIKFLEFKNIKLDLEKYLFSVDDKIIRLTKTEFLIVKLFLENIGKIFSRDEIITKVWDDVYVTDRTVDVHIRRLRKKMENAGNLVHTYSGFGYGILEDK